MSRWLIQSSIELSAFDIVWALANFVVEFTLQEDKKQECTKDSQDNEQREDQY